MLDEVVESTNKLSTFLLKTSKVNMNGGLWDLEFFPIRVALSIVFYKSSIIVFSHYLLMVYFHLNNSIKITLLRNLRDVKEINIFLNLCKIFNNIVFHIYGILIDSWGFTNILFLRSSTDRI